MTVAIRNIAALAERASTAAGRPSSATIELGVLGTARDGLLAGDSAVVTSLAQFPLRPAAAGGALELALPHADARVLEVRHGSTPLRHAVDGPRLVTEHPGEGTLTVRLALQSGPGRPVRLESGRVVVGDVVPRIVDGAEVRGPVPHFRTGVVPPDGTEYLVRIRSRGWELAPDARLTRRSPDHVDPYTDLVQQHLGGDRSAGFAATADFTGRAGGRATEGPIADARRAAHRAAASGGGTIHQLLEHR